MTTTSLQAPSRVARLCALLLALLCLAARAEEAPQQLLARYYELITYNFAPQAYGLKSAAARRRQSLAEFRRQWAANVQITPVGIRPGRRKGELRYRLYSVDYDAAHDLCTRSQYQAQAVLTHETGGWRVDRVEVHLLTSAPYPPLPHGWREGAAPALPADIPVYPGFRMSPPLVRVEPGGSPAFSVASLNRVDQRPLKILKWYQQHLPGWKCSGPAGGPGCLGAGFSRGRRTVSVSIYLGLTSASDSPDHPRGSRLEIHYDK